MAKALERELLPYVLRLEEAEKKSVLQMLKTFLKGREKKLPRILKFIILTNTSSIITEITRPLRYTVSGLAAW